MVSLFGYVPFITSADIIVNHTTFNFFTYATSQFLLFLKVSYFSRSTPVIDTLDTMFRLDYVVTYDFFDIDTKSIEDT